MWKIVVVFVGLLVVFFICWVLYFILEFVVDDVGMEFLFLWVVYMLFYFIRFVVFVVNLVLIVVGKSDFWVVFCEWLYCCGIIKDDEVVYGIMYFFV